MCLFARPVSSAVRPLVTWFLRRPRPSVRRSGASVSSVRAHLLGHCFGAPLPPCPFVYMHGTMTITANTKWGEHARSSLHNIWTCALLRLAPFGRYRAWRLRLDGCVSMDCVGGSVMHSFSKLDRSPRQRLRIFQIHLKMCSAFARYPPYREAAVVLRPSVGLTAPCRPRPVHIMALAY
jgi:hypothetical protein